MRTPGRQTTMLDEYNEMNPKPQNIAKLGAAVDVDQSDQTTCKSV